MTKIIVISLIFSLGTLPMTQAKTVGEGGLGRLAYGVLRDGNIVGDLFGGATGSLNGAVCRLFGPGFLPSMSKNNCCPEGSFAANTFDSFESLCEYLRCKPHLLNCITPTALTIPLSIPGVTDYPLRLGKCCNIDLPSHKSQLGGDVGRGLLIADFPRNPNALVNEVAYGVTDEASDLLCSLVGTKFLNIHLTDSGCNSDKLTQNALESKESFCDHFRTADEDTQQCLTDAAIELLVNLKGITSVQYDFATCCASCPGKQPANPPPPCKPNPPVIIPKC